MNVRLFKIQDYDVISFSSNQSNFLLLGKDIEIALTEIRELQNEIDTLKRDEVDKQNIIDELQREKNALQG